MKFRCYRVGVGSLTLAHNDLQLTEGGELTEYSNLKAEIYE